MTKYPGRAVAMSIALFVLAAPTRAQPLPHDGGMDDESRVLVGDSTGRDPSRLNACGAVDCRTAQPFRSFHDFIQNAPGVVRLEGRDEFRLRAGHSGETPVFIGGIRILEPRLLPWSLIRSATVYDGYLRARLGYGLDGAVVVEPGFHAEERLRVRTDGSFSNGLDQYGYRDASLTVGGRVANGALGGFVSGSLIDMLDATPRAIGTLRLTEDALQMLRSSPTVVRVRQDGMDDTIYPLPAAATVGTTHGELRGMLDLTPEQQIVSVSEKRTDHLTDSDFTHTDALPFNGYTGWSLAGGADLEAGGLRSSLFAALQGSERDVWSRGESLFDGRTATRSDLDNKLFIASVAYGLGGVTFKASAGLQRHGIVSFDPEFSSQTGDLIYYGDIDHEANSALRRHFNLDSADDGALTYLFEDGRGPTVDDMGHVIAGTFESLYRKQAIEQRAVSGGVDVSLPRAILLSVGLTHESRTERLLEASPAGLARFVSDSSGPEGFDPMDTAYDPDGYADYAGIPPELLDYDRRHGYDVYGANEVDSEDLSRLITSQRKPAEHYDVAPLTPTTTSLFADVEVPVTDRVTFTAGVRADRFDARALGFFDPYSRLEIVRAGDVPSAPSGIGDDFAVYYIANGNTVLGYRSLDGHYFDVSGNPAEPADAVFSGHERELAARNTPAVFAPVEARVAVQPRFEIAVQSGSLAGAAYFMRVAQMPWWAMRAATPDLFGTGNIPGNPALEPEYVSRIGLRATAVSEAYTLYANAFARRYSGLVTLYRWRLAHPREYHSFENTLSIDQVGLLVGAEVRLSPNITGHVDYLGVNTQSASLLLSDRTRSAAAHARSLNRHAHNLQVAAVVRFGRGDGPRIGSISPLARFSFAAQLTSRDGEPYFPSEIRPLVSQVFARPTGELARAPWSHLLNVSVERSFEVSGVTGSIFVWIQNVLDRDNVLSVWAGSGLGDDDGYLSTEEGQLWLSLRTEAWEILYRNATADPSHYGIPRLIRLGARLGF